MRSFIEWPIHSMPKLVVSDLAEDVAIANWDEVVDLVDAAIGR